VINGFLQNSLRAARRIYRKKSPLAHTPHIDNKCILFMGGLHKSGTSILHRLLRAHPSISGFADTGVAEDEGQHLQSVFPPAHRYGGPGEFAFDLRSHLSEDSVLISPDNRDKLLREWGSYYDLSKEVLLEKSPPNLVRSRFFQALFPHTCFVFIVRHPIPVALATRKWTNVSITQLLLHWHVAYSVMSMDLRYIKHYALIRYEDFVESPQAHLDKICDLVEVERFTPLETVANHNPEYYKIWKREYGKDCQVIEGLFPLKQSPMDMFGYSLSEPFVKVMKSPDN